MQYIACSVYLAPSLKPVTRKCLYVLKVCILKRFSVSLFYRINIEHIPGIPESFTQRGTAANRIELALALIYYMTTCDMIYDLLWILSITFMC